MKSNPDISIIICTSNRAEHLRQTLKAMAQICLPHNLTAELLIVDNASKDHTPQVAADFPASPLTARYLQEPRIGQVRARNTGLAHAQGDIIVFTDDDIRPDPDWLESLCHPILTGQSDAAQGAIRFAPHLKRDWMEPMHRGYFADTVRWHTVEPRRMVGANMAFSRDVLRKVPAFDPELGPGALGFWDDSLFSQQVAAAGFTIWPELRGGVEHHFEASRMLKAHMLQRAEKDGRSNAYVSYHWDHYDAPTPEQSLRHARMGLRTGRLTGKARWPGVEGASLWELEWVFKVGYYEQYLIERSRPRNYDKNGLVKIPHA